MDDPGFDLVLHTISNARDFLPAMEWAVCEMVDNIHIHSQTVVPGVLTAQFFPQQHRLDIAICDLGRGIKSSLEESRVLHSHGEAIQLALQRGVTRSQAVGQGNGLAGAVEITACNEGDFEIWSGDVNYRMHQGRSRGFEQLPVIPGTGLLFRLDTNKPVILGQTFIGASSWSYLDATRDRILDAGGIPVKDECVSTGSRQAAKGLRLKLQALLPDMEEPLVIDFDGVEIASSSFLDELLGRLAAEIGEETFRRRIRIVNASEIIRDMANTVIHQRLETGNR